MAPGFPGFDPQLANFMTAMSNQQLREAMASALAKEASPLKMMEAARGQQQGFTDSLMQGGLVPEGPRVQNPQPGGVDTSALANFASQQFAQAQPQGTPAAPAASVPATFGIGQGTPLPTAPRPQPVSLSELLRGGV